MKTKTTTTQPAGHTPGILISRQLVAGGQIELNTFARHCVPDLEDIEESIGECLSLLEGDPETNAQEVIGRLALLQVEARAVIARAKGVQS